MAHVVCNRFNLSRFASFARVDCLHGFPLSVLFARVPHLYPWQQHRNDRETTDMAKLTRKQIREGLDQIPMDGLLFGTAAAKAAEAKLTPKQREFARMIALGESKAGAYRQVYNSKGKPTTQRAEGYKLSVRPDIAMTTEAFKQAIVFAESHTPAQIRAFVIQQLTQHAQNEDNPPAQRIKSLELLGKVAEVGAFVDRKEVVNVQSSQTIRDRLLEKLAASGRTIEHKPEDTDADSLMAELTPAPAETTESVTHPPGTPGILGGCDVEDAHIIPHKQTSPIPHNQTPSIPPSTDTNTEVSPQQVEVRNSAV